MGKLTKQIPAWHAKVIAEIERDYAETNELTETARRRRARLGMMLIWIKAVGKADGSIPHGEFQPWMKKNLPGIPLTTAGNYITEAKSICDLLGWQITQIGLFETPPHKLLTAKPEELSTADKAHQKKLLTVVDEQSHFAAVTQYKQVELKDDATVPKVGRRKGEGGASREQRVAHKIKLREMSLAEKRAAMLNAGHGCDLVFDELIADPELADAFDELFPKVENLYQFMQRTRAARKGK